MSEEKKAPLNTKNIMIVVIVLLLGAVAYFAITGKDNNILNKNETKKEEQKSDKYQAVFLTNGQVYFGKLEDKAGDYVKLTDIYYLQSKDQEKVKQETAQSQEPNLTLIKLGKELHAPADEMNISKQQVLFWEDITKDGKVMKAIEEYKSSNK